MHSIIPSSTPLGIVNFIIGNASVLNGTNYFFSLISAAIIYYYNFKIRICLSEDVSQRLCNKMTAVIGGNYYREKYFAGHCQYFFFRLKFFNLIFAKMLRA